MKRHGNLYDFFISEENIIHSYKSAILGKMRRKDVLELFFKGEDYVVSEITKIFQNGWIPSPYKKKTINDKGKQRDLLIAPLFPDRIIHHMINNTLDKVYKNILIKDTYQCIVGRGVHKAIEQTRRYAQNPHNTWALKIDITKYYPSIDNEILKSKLRRKIKDKKFLFILDSLIDSAKGLPLGNHTSQLLGNIFLTDLDYSLKEISSSYIRYADDMVLFGNKDTVKEALKFVIDYIQRNNLKLNPSTQYFNTRKRTLEFLGFRFLHRRDDVFVRAKKSKLINKRIDEISLPSVFGWLKESKALIFLHKVHNIYSPSKKFLYFYKFLEEKIYKYH